MLVLCLEVGLEKAVQVLERSEIKPVMKLEVTWRQAVKVIFPGKVAQRPPFLSLGPTLLPL